MQPLLSWLNDHGSDAMLVKLSGHHDGSIPIIAVTRANWEEDMREGYAAARKLGDGQGVPVYFLGYSLGALLGQRMMSGEGWRIDKLVLFAPATAIRPRAYLLKWLFGFGDRLLLRSYAPTRYKVNKRLPVRIYKIMFDLEAECLKEDKRGRPALVFLDPMDELVSYRKIRALEGIEVVPLGSDMQGRDGGYHHLIIDEGTMGRANWVMVTERMKDFLFRD